MSTGTKEAGWVQQMIEAPARIRAAVDRLNNLIRIEPTAATGQAPTMLDTRRSIAPPPATPARRPAEGGADHPALPRVGDRRRRLPRPVHRLRHPAGWIYDHTGAYALAWWLAAAFNALALGLVALARPPRPVAERRAAVVISPTTS
ncbi:MAG: hypothetical protein ABW020_14405 [Candidatus Rokuibacteriota bacterium]